MEEERNGKRGRTGGEVVQTKGERGRKITISPLNVYHAVCGGGGGGGEKGKAFS